MKLPNAFYQFVSFETKKYFKNFTFLFFEKIIRVIISLLIISQISRYLGPDNYGILSIVESILSILIAVSAVGLDPIVIKSLKMKKYGDDVVLGTAFLFKLIASILTLFFCLIVIEFFVEDTNIKLGTYVLFPAIIFSSFNVVDYYYQYKVQSKYPVYARFFSFLFSTLLKLIVIIYALNWTYLFYIILFDQLFITLSYIYIRPSCIDFTKIKFSKRLANNFLSASFYLTISAISIIFLSRTDQIMIKSMLTNFDLGNYSASQKIVEVSYIIPTILMSSILPKIIEKLNSGIEEQNLFLARLFKIVVLSSIIVSALIFLSSDALILLIFGNKFTLSSKLLRIYSFCIIFYSIKVSFQQVLYAKGLEKNIMFQSIFTFIINVILNYFFIDYYGVYGAVYATLISLVFSSIIYDFFDKDLRKFIKYKFLLS